MPANTLLAGKNYFVAPGYAFQISNGEYEEWLPLILPNAKALENFPLRLVVVGCGWSMPLFQQSPATGSKTVS
jgi:hypothetical protein